MFVLGLGKHGRVTYLSKDNEEQNRNRKRIGHMTRSPDFDAWILPDAASNPGQTDQHPVQHIGARSAAQSHRRRSKRHHKRHQDLEPDQKQRDDGDDPPRRRPVELPAQLGVDGVRNVC